jgi:hypothetical protein
MKMKMAAKCVNIAHPSKRNDISECKFFVSFSFMQSKIHDGENNAHDSRAGVIGHPQKTTNVSNLNYVAVQVALQEKQVRAPKKPKIILRAANNEKFLNFWRAHTNTREK